MKQDYRVKHGRKIYDAIFYKGLPDAACEWPLVEQVATVLIVGSGESTSWNPTSTIRFNGKQIDCATGYSIESMQLPPRLVHIGKYNRSNFYIQYPEFIPSN